MIKKLIIKEVFRLRPYALQLQLVLVAIKMYKMSNYSRGKCKSMSAVNNSITQM